MKIIITEKTVLSLIVSFCIFGTQTFALGLQEGLAETLSKHPIVKERYENYKATLEDLRISESAYLPSLDYIGTIARDTTDNRNTSFNEVTLSNYEHSLQLTQNLFNGFGTLYEADYQKARILAAANHYIENANDIAYGFINQYINVLRSREALEVAKESVSFHEGVLAKVKKLFDAGATTRSELEKIDTSLSLARSNHVVAQNNLEDALFNFERVFGRFVQAEDFEKVSFVGEIPGNIDDMKAFARTHNPSVLVSHYNIKAAQSRYQMMHKNYYPKIDAYARKSWSKDTGGQIGDEDVTSFGITITYNLYRGGADEAQIQKSLAENMKEKELKNDVIRKLDEQGKLSWNARVFLSQQLEYLDRYSQTSKKTLELYQQEYDLGRRTLLDLLVAQNDYVAARSQVIKAQNDLLFANYRILDSMGTMVQNVLGSSALDFTKKVKLDVADAGLNHDENIGTLLFTKRESNEK